MGGRQRHTAISRGGRHAHLTRASGGGEAYWGHVLRGRCNSEPVVTVHDPYTASVRLIR